MKQKETVGSVQFEGKHIVVNVDDGPFGDKELVARFDAHEFYPFTPQSADPGLFDLLDFCIAFYALDRFIVRPEAGWTRPFAIRLPVYDLSLWRENVALIREWIYALTNDEVEIIPVARSSSGSHHERPPHFGLDDRADVVGLVSEGLDSLCGVDAAIRRSDRKLAWASIVSGQKRPRIQKTVDMSRKLSTEPIRHFKVRTSLKMGASAYEKTQRSRTVLAVVMALTVAQAIGADSVECYENGIGLLNLPVPDLQFGAMSTQVLHPRSLPLWDRISRAFFGRTIELRYPNRFLTKSEMIRTLSEPALRLIPTTFSCDAPHRKRKSVVLHCGTCGSCRFRQLSLYDAGIGTDAPYAFEFRKRNKIDAGRLLHYHADLLSEALNTPDPWVALCLLQPELRGTDLSDGNRPSARGEKTLLEHQHFLRSETVDLLRRHSAAVRRWTEPHNAA